MAYESDLEEHSFVPNYFEVCVDSELADFAQSQPDEVVDTLLALVGAEAVVNQLQHHTGSLAREPRVLETEIEHFP